MSAFSCLSIMKFTADNLILFSVPDVVFGIRVLKNSWIHHPMGVIVSCRGKKEINNSEDEEHRNPDSPDPDNILTPIQTTNEFIRPLEHQYPPTLPPVDEVEYGRSAAASGMARPKTYAVVVSRLAGHKWLKLKLEPRDRNFDNQTNFENRMDGGEWFVAEPNKITS